MKDNVQCGVCRETVPLALASLVTKSLSVGSLPSPWPGGYGGSTINHSTVTFALCPACTIDVTDEYHSLAVAAQQMARDEKARA